MDPKFSETEQKRRSWVFPVTVFALGCVAVTAWLMMRDQSDAPVKAKASSVVTITMPPPPPPPPPVIPPPPQNEPPPEQEEMIAQEPVAEEEPPPDNSPPPDEPPADLSTGLTGDGPNSFGLTQGGGGGKGGTGTGSGTGRQTGSKYGFYAGQVQSAVADAVKRSSKTRSATLDIQVKIWADSTGRITRAKLSKSTGNPTLDSAISNEVLTGLQLKQAPPADMPMPIHLRIRASKTL